MSSSKIFERTSKSLDFNDIRQKLASHCKTDAGTVTCETVRPAKTIHEADKELDLTEEMVSIAKLGENLFPSQVDDPRKVTEKIETGTLPEPEDIKSIISFGRQLERINNFKTSSLPNIKNLLEITDSFEPLEELVGFLEATFDGDGNVKPTATANLMQIEERINSLKKKIAEKAEALLLRDDVKDILQESYISVRNDRIVIPVKAEYKNIFPGIIHNISGSEHTAFMEPQELIKPNNSLREAISEREEEVRRLLRETATKLRENRKQIEQNYIIIGKLDSINAKALFSININGNRPSFSTDGPLSIFGLKNPLMLIMDESPAQMNL